MRIELSIPQDFLDLLSATGGIFYGDIDNRFVKAITTDSRECIKGDIFFALDGNTKSGNNYITDAINRGAIPVGRGVKRYGIRVDSANDALLSFASFYKQALPNLIHTTAITGSVGKTTTKEFLKVLSNTRYKTHATWENFNNDIGASLTVLSADKDTEVLILEFGMNHAGEIKKLSTSFAPNSAVITKIGSAHIGMLGGKEGIAKAKLEIISGLKGTLLIPKGEVLLSTNYPKKNFFSTKDISADMTILKNSFDRIELYYKRDLISIFDFPIKADHILECLAASSIAACELGLNPDEIVRGISMINNDSLRHKITKSSKGYTVIDDAYNASYESVIAALDMLSKINGANKKYVLLGDILELGDYSYDIHYSIGRMIPAFNIDYLLLIGENSSAISEGAISGGFDKERIFNLNNTVFPKETAEFIRGTLTLNDVILLKASHQMRLDKIIELIR